MFSVITCSVNPARFNAVADQWKRAFDRAAEPFQLICVQDARSLCEGYNRGLAAAQGEHVIFAHDDIELLSDDFIPRLKHHLATYDGVGVAGTSKLVGVSWLDAGPPHVFGHVAHWSEGHTCNLMIYGGTRRAVPNIQALDGVCLAFRRHAIQQIGWDAQTFTGFHFYDLDTTYRAFRAGFKLAVALDLLLCHHSGGSYNQAWQQYATLFLQKHRATLEPWPRRKVIPMGVIMNAKEDIRRVMGSIVEALPE